MSALPGSTIQRPAARTTNVVTTEVKDMTDSIIVGISAAAAGRRAADWAAHRAVASNAELVLLTVVAKGDDDVDAGQARLEAVRAALVETPTAVITRVVSGHPTDELTRASEGATLLVIGSDHPREPRRGDRGRKIVADAHCTVVVVPDIDTTGRRGVVVGVDGSLVTDAAVQFAAAEAELSGEPVIGVGVWAPPPIANNMGMTGDVFPVGYPIDLQEPTRVLVDGVLDPLRAAHPNMRISTRVEEGEPGHVLNDLARDAALVVVGTHGRGRLARFFLGSVSDQVLTHLATVTAVVR